MAAMALPIPVVDLIEPVVDVPDDGLLHVCMDNKPVGAAAFEHFRSAGFRDFAYLPWNLGPDSILREQGFRTAAEEAGLGHRLKVLPCVLSTTDWTRDVHAQAEIFATLPRRCGMLCFSDWLANLAIHALRIAKIKVPEEIAVISVGNDRMICESTVPALSSIDPHLERIGYLAAERVVRAVEEKEGIKPEPVIRVPARGVVSRASSETFATSDPDVARAIRFLQESIARESYPSVQQVANAAGLSRRHLDTKFQEEVGHTVAAEIKRQRLRVIRQLLAEGELSLIEIVIRTDSGSLSQLCRLVRQETGMTPRQYRQWSS